MSYWTEKDFGSYDFGAAPSTDPKLTEFSSKIKELTSVQAKVDAGLKNMPAGPDKDRLLKLRAESRGIFSTYILPAWNKIKEYTSGAFAGEEDDAMGIIPLIPIALVTAATAALGYVGKSIYTETKILNDPSFTAAQKTQLLSGGGLQSIASSLSSVKNIAIIGAIGFIAWQFYKAKKMAR